MPESYDSKHTAQRIKKKKKKWQLGYSQKRQNGADGHVTGVGWFNGIRQHRADSPAQLHGQDELALKERQYSLPQIDSEMKEQKQKKTMGEMKDKCIHK